MISPATPSLDTYTFYTKHKLLCTNTMLLENSHQHHATTYLDNPLLCLFSTAQRFPVTTSKSKAIYNPPGHYTIPEP